MKPLALILALPLTLLGCANRSLAPGPGDGGPPDFAHEDLAHVDLAEIDLSHVDLALPDLAHPPDLTPPPPPSKLPPRLVAPLSTSTVSTNRPRLRWDMTGVTGSSATVHLCADRACANPLGSATVDATGASAQPDQTLAPGLVFWNVTAGGRTSATWQLTVRRPTDSPTSAIDSSFGTQLDVDGDGVPDVAVGAPVGPATTGIGAVALYTHGVAGTSAAAQTIAGPDGTNAHFGSVVASAGDLNGDGFADLVVGDCNTHTTTGAVHIYYGGADGIAPTTASRVQTLTVPDLQTGFGCRLSPAGDLNGDGYADLAVGRVGADIGGGIYIYYGSAKGVPTTATRIDSPNQSPSRLGYSLSAGGDINGDGYADLLASELTYSDLSGQVHIYWGSKSGISAKNVKNVASPDQSGQQFGCSVSGAGDFNGDGYSDFVVGAATASGANLPPRVHYYYGSAAGLSSTVDTVDGSTIMAPAKFGIEVEVIGDYNGDGYDDVMVSATDSVTLIVSSIPLILPSWEKAVGQGQFLRAVSGLGDFNGDGYGDVVLGGSSSAEVVLGVPLFFEGPIATPTIQALTAPVNLAGFGNAVY